MFLIKINLHYTDKIKVIQVFETKGIIYKI